jgi:hypothetical protein
MQHGRTRRGVPAGSTAPETLSKAKNMKACEENKGGKRWMEMRQKLNFYPQTKFKDPKFCASFARYQTGSHFLALYYCIGLLLWPHFFDTDMIRYFYRVHYHILYAFVQPPPRNCVRKKERMKTFGQTKFLWPNLSRHRYLDSKLCALRANIIQMYIAYTTILLNACLLPHGKLNLFNPPKREWRHVEKSG